MALLVAPMSAIPHIQHHMTSAHGHSVPSNLSHNSANAVTQSGNKRPKLSLQTTSLTSTYGSLTRGIAPNTTQATYTPTTANTLSNTWDLSIRPSPVSRTESPRPLSQVRSQAVQQPYTYSLPFGVKPILKNSPLPPRAASVSASPRESRRKVFFPQPKRVLFKQDLEEIIETKQYVVKHSDLTSSGDETSDDEPQSEPTDLAENEITPSTYHNSPPPNRKRKVRRDSGIAIEPEAESSAQLTTTTDQADDETAISRPPLPCKRRKRQSSRSTFGGLTEKEGTALLRRSSSTSTSENMICSPGMLSKSRQLSAAGEEDEKEDCEAPSEDGRRTSSPLAASVSQDTSDPNSYGISFPLGSENGASKEADRDEDT